MFDAIRAISHVLLGGKIEPETLAQAQRATLAMVDDSLRQYSSFALRLTLSAVIATGGIAAGSTAVVIGAMLIAPLMSPMLGIALATVMGRPRAAARALIVTIIGALACVGLAAVVALIVPVSINTATNQEVLARTSPRLVDFVVALASGTMAAIATMRSDIPDAAPGIAISASIVPPLCVVGVSLEAGDIPAAQGAGLLFFANFFAIQVMCFVVFLAMGLGRQAYSEMASRLRVLWCALAIAGALGVAVPLAAASVDMIAASARERATQDAVAAWLDGSDYRLRFFDIDSDACMVEISGVGVAPSTSSLVTELRRRDVGLAEVRVAVVAEHRAEVLAR